MGMITGWVKVNVAAKNLVMWNNHRAMLLDNQFKKNGDRFRNWVSISQTGDGRWKVEASSMKGFTVGHPQSSKEKARKIAMKFMRKYPFGHPWGKPLTTMPRHKKGTGQK